VIKINKNIFVKYIFVILLLWSFLLLEPNLLANPAEENAQELDSTKRVNRIIEQNILNEQDLDFFETIGIMSKTIAYALSNAGYTTHIYYDKATFVTTEKHLIIIGHGSEACDKYFIEDLGAETVINLANQFELTALLSCKSSEIIQSSLNVLSFEDEVNTVDALKYLSEFLNVEIETQQSMGIFALFDPFPGLDPGPGGGGGDPLGEGWVSQTASITYDSIWYYFNLRTASGAAEFEQFINTYPSQNVAIRYKGYFNYKDPESSSAYGWMEDEDGALITVILNFDVKIVWKEVIVQGESEIHCFLVGLDYKYNNVEDPRYSYTEEDLNDTNCNEHLMDIYGSIMLICATFTATFATLGITIFMKGIGLSLLSTSQIGGYAFSTIAAINLASSVCLIIAAVALIILIVVTILYFLEASSC